jgi:hypothetical protein
MGADSSRRLYHNWRLLRPMARHYSARCERPGPITRVSLVLSSSFVPIFRFRLVPAGRAPAGFIHIEMGLNLHGGLNGGMNQSEGRTHARNRSRYSPD